MRSTLVLTVCCTALLAGALRAQATAARPPQSLRASPTSGPIKLDGVLEPSEWGNAEVATNFVQRYPDPGHTATMRTEVRVRYDHHAMYVGARLFDPHPDSIAAPLGRKDPGDVSSDWFDVIFDSYGDRRTAFRFAVNPAGTKLDVYHFNDTDDDDSWDAIWDAATRIDSLGWTAEFRIPLSQLRFHGSAGEQIWGLQFYRAVARRGEWSFWAPFLPTMPGFVSNFGTLTGLVGLQPPSPLEAVPYVTSNLSAGRAAGGSPFYRSVDGGAGAGLDFRAGLGSALSVTGTLNPDFGQVEVDPAVLNLSSVETFYPEKRPFFLEGSGIFNFGGPPVYKPYGFSRLVHWRRIGRAPQLSASAPWSDAPAQTTILGAAKLSGQLDGGWSLGMMDATTQQERARTVSATGDAGSAVVEPLTNYLVARVKRDLQSGRTSVGLLTTATIRDLDPQVAQLLRGSGYVAGLDATHASRNHTWTLSAYAVGSWVEGSAPTIAATQRSSVRYLDRPDATHLSYDPLRTSLSGHDADVSLIHFGKPWFGSVQFHETSPGFESNDLGYLSRADLRSLSAAAGLASTKATGLIRDGQVTGYAQQALNFDGNVIARRYGMTASTQLPSQWFVSMLADWSPSVWSDRLTRGGPLTRRPERWEVGGGVATDPRHWLRGRTDLVASNNGAQGTATDLLASITARPLPSLQVSLTMTGERLRDEAQYVRTVVDPTAVATYGQRYVFASLKQHTLSADVRVDWTLTPALSVQVFAQPLVARSEFRDYKQLRQPGTFVFDVFGRDAGTVTARADGLVEIDPDGGGPAASFLIGDGANQRSFLSRALRANVVLRWEYRAGSLLYVVWQQSRDGLFDILQEPDQRVPGIFGVHPLNVLLVKASYRFGR